MAQDRLTRFLALGENIIAFAQATGEPIAAILSWLAQPAVADTIARFHAAQDSARTQAALNTLHRITIDSPDPTEQRRAATTLLRHTRPASCSAPQASCPPKSSPATRAASNSASPASVPSNSMPGCLVPRSLPLPSTKTLAATTSSHGNANSGNANRGNANSGHTNSENTSSGEANSEEANRGNTTQPPPTSAIPPSSATELDFQLAILELHRPTDEAEFTFNPALAVYLPLPNHFPKHPAHLSLGPDADFFAFTSALMRLPDSS